MARIAERRATVLEGTQPLTSTALIAALSGQPSVTGRALTAETALKMSAVYAAVRVLSESVASLPLITYRRLNPRGKEREPRHRWYRLLHDEPNPWMSSMQWRETQQGHLLTWGNAYSEIEWDRDGEPVALWPLRPDLMDRPKRAASGLLLYPYRVPTGEPKLLPQANVLHIRGLSSDGLVGYSPITLAREAIGLGLAIEEFGARLFGNSATPRGILTVKGGLTGPQAERLKASWELAHRGLEQAHRTAVLEEGLTWQSIGLPPEDAQFIAARKFQIEEIARIFRVPPHMLGDLDRATFGNIEHQSLEFVRDSLRPWLVRWEQEINRSLLMGAEKDTYFVEFLIDALLRGDSSTRHRAYAQGRQWGYLSANDIREMENMNPIEGGDQYLVPLNMAPTEQIEYLLLPDDIPGWRPKLPEDEKVAPSKRPDEGKREVRSVATGAASRRQLAELYRPLFLDAAARIVRREANDVSQAMQRHLPRQREADFRVWLDEYYAGFAEHVQRAFAPIYGVYSRHVYANAAGQVGAEAQMPTDFERFVEALVKTMAEHHARKSAGELRDVLAGAASIGQDAVDAIEQRLSEWIERRPGKIAKAETVRASGAVTREAWRRAGVRMVRWDASEGACVYCRGLHGQAASVEGHFLGEGARWSPEGAEEPLFVRRQIGHPPLHGGGCKCGLEPGLDVPVEQAQPVPVVHITKRVLRDADGRISEVVEEHRTEVK